MAIPTVSAGHDWTSKSFLNGLINAINDRRRANLLGSVYVFGGTDLPDHYSIGDDVQGY